MIDDTDTILNNVELIDNECLMILDVRENSSIGGIGVYLDGYIDVSLGDDL